jgi:hypothetical protein
LASFGLLALHAKNQPVVTRTTVSNLSATIGRLTDQSIGTCQT